MLFKTMNNEIKMNKIFSKYDFFFLKQTFRSFTDWLVYVD